MLTELTPEQEKQMIEFRDKIKNDIRNNYERLELTQDLIDDINWLYTYSNDKLKPLVWVVDSPLMLQIMGNFLPKILPKLVGLVNNNINNNIYDNINNNIYDNIRDNIHNNIYNNISDNICDNIHDNIYNNICDNIHDNIYNNICDNICDNITATITANITANIRDMFHNLKYVWTMGGKNWRFAWYSYQKFCIELMPKISTNKFEKLYSLFSRPIWDILTLRGICILCRMPTKIRIDDNERLHGGNKPDVEWGDGLHEDYMIHGVRFTSVMKKKIINRELSSKEIISIQNTDQRFVAMQYYGFENLLDNLEPELLDSGRFGNKLMSIQFDGEILKFLTYPDIDNKKVKRVKFIDPSFKKADEAMAAYHNCKSVEQYYKMEILQSWK